MARAKHASGSPTPVIARLRPREQEYTVWDSRLPGLGVRVRPSGGRSWIFLLKTGGGTRKARFPRSGGAEDSRAGLAASAMSYPRHPATSASPRRSGLSVPSFRNFRRRRVEDGPLRPIQAIDATKGVRSYVLPGPAPAGVRIEAARSHHPLHRSGAGSTNTAGPPLAAPTMPSTSCGKS